MNKLKLLFQGDSVTDSGRPKDFKGYNAGFGMGYVSLIASRLLCDHPEIQVYNRGYGGNRIVDMYARWSEDALNIPFNVISILNGINDVGFGIRLGCGADENKFKFVYDRILYETKEKKPDCDIILCQPFILKMHAENEFNDDIYNNWELWEDMLKKRGEVIRQLASEYKCTFVPLWDYFTEALKTAPAEHWSADCIHPTYAGCELIARAWLERAEPILDKYFGG